MQEVVGDFIQISIQGGQERVETGQLTGLDCLTPVFDGLRGLGFGQILLEDGGQLFTEVIG